MKGECTVGYHRPDRVADAFAALAQGASVIAGGTDWYPSRGDGPLPKIILDVTRLPGFSGITREADGWRIGAATSWTTLAKADLPRCFDGLRAAAREVGSRQIQNTGTIGGNLCNASPAADGVPALLTLNASVRMVSDRGERDLPLDEFITGPRKTALGDGELLASVWVPDPGPLVGAFQKLGARKYLVISIAMVAALARVEAGRFADVRVAVGACGPVARRLEAVEQALRGKTLAEAETIIASAALPELSPISDVRGSAEFRLDVVRDMILRALASATGGDHG